tara:strand:- start:404 stop:1501 length:1098 start_codon:yes stop_codon:yes gene_type:complete
MNPFNIFSGEKKNTAGRFLKKSSSFKNPVIFIDGFNGSGKTLLAPIVSALPKVELLTFAYPVEWISSILYSDNISPDAYKEFIKMFVDESIYNQQMSRSINFRHSDLSSVFRSSKKFTYFSRLFKKGDDHVVEIINNSNPISSFTTNCLLPFFPVLNEALHDRLLFIETVKDPLTMFEQVYILRKNIINTKSEKDFTFRSFSESNDLSFLDFYSDNNVYEDNHSLGLEENIVNWLERILNFTISCESSKDNSRILFVPFEDFVLNPMPFIKIIAQKNEVSIDKKTKTEIKKQKVPRKILSAGLKIPIYKKYGAKNSNFKTLEEERIGTLNYIKNLMNDDKSYNKLIKISEKYNKWRNKYVERLPL